jgi:hypothetical protein
MLIHKIISCGITGNMLNWIKSFLAQRLMRVRFHGHKSRYRIQRQGLPQGAVLSCALFNIMINDVLTAVRSVPGVEALLYADDLMLWAHSRNFTGLESCINLALKRLEAWADLNHTTVSPSKTVPTFLTIYKLGRSNFSTREKESNRKTLLNI